MRRPLCVTLQPSDNLGWALRKLRHAVEHEGVFADLAKHRYHLSPSERRRRKAQRAERRRQQEARRERNRRPRRP